MYICSGIDDYHVVESIGPEMADINTFPETWGHYLYILMV